VKTPVKAKNRIVVWEALDPTDEVVAAAGRLYESTLDPDERIPWEWIEKSVLSRSWWKPGGWSRHLILAAPMKQVNDPAALAGYCFAAFLPGFGGYVSYMGVSPEYRGRGVGRRLFEHAFKHLAADAHGVDEPLPFVAWESKPPGPNDRPEEQANWAARLALFAKVGGHHVSGLTLWQPNYADPAGPPVGLDLFVKPVDTPTAAFDSVKLREIAAEFYRRVYRLSPDDPLVSRTQTDAVVPKLDDLPKARPTRRAGLQPA
jgi:GNAT superfamily N-acetyltransferase